MRWMSEGGKVGWRGWRGQKEVVRAEVGARRAGRRVRQMGGWRRWDWGGWGERCSMADVRGWETKVGDLRNQGRERGLPIL